MAWPFKEVLFDILGGLNTLDNPADIQQDPRQVHLGLEDPRFPLHMAQANDVYAPTTRTDLSTRPGFQTVRSNTINASGVFTSFVHLGEIADRFLMMVSDGSKHSIYQDNANPPTEITGGANPTVGQNNLCTPLLFRDSTQAGAIFLFLQRDAPQFVNGAGVRSTLAISGTGFSTFYPAIGEIFGQRAVYANYSQDGTVYDDRAAWTQIRNGQVIDDITTDFESFETYTKDRIRGIRKLSDLCVIGKLNNIFTMILTPDGAKPFTIQEEPAGRYKGPISNNFIEANQKLYWMGQTNIHSIDQNFVIADHADRIKPTLLALNDGRREFIISGYDHDRDLVLFSCTNGGGSTHNVVIALNIKTGALFLWTLSRNAFGYRLVAGDTRLIGGGYIGKFYTEMTGVLGSADDATAVIDADIITPLHHCGSPNVKKLFAGIKVWFVNQSTSEAVTVQWRTDTNNAFAAFSASPYTVTSSDKPKFFPLMKAGIGLQLEFKDATTGQAFRVAKYSLLYKNLEPALV